MQLDNKTKAGQIKLLYMLILLLIIIGIGAFYLITESRSFRPAIFGFAVLAAFIFLSSFLRFNYVSFFIGPEVIRIRYKLLSPFATSNNSIQIKAEQLRKFEIVPNKKAIGKALQLYVQTASGIAQYDPISLNGLSAAAIEKATKALQLLVAMNQAGKDKASENED